jgi:cell fate regulator YaaT (PSP1 superfamily)
MATAVGVVFSPGGKVYSFDPDGLELAWNAKVICHTSRGQELGRVVQPNHELESQPAQPLKRVVRRASAADEEVAAENRLEAKRAMKVLREVLRTRDYGLKPVSAELVFDRSRVVFSYQSEGRLELGELQELLRRRLDRRVELRAVGPRECARLCGDHGLCGDQHCCRKFQSHEQPITLRMAKEQELPMSSGRITGLCGRLRCCLAFEHPTYKSYRDRAPRMGRRVDTPQGGGVVTAYHVLADTCTVEVEGGDTFDVAIDECREVA